MHPDVTAAKAAIEQKLNGRKPAIGIVLGSGLSPFADRLENPARLAYNSIPGFRTSSVPGHPGQLVAGTLHGKNIAVLQGRLHFYEGISLHDVTFPIRVLDAIGVKILIITSTAGGINSQLRPGGLMMVEDHINFMGVNPLIGNPHQESNAVRFLDLSQAYSSRLREKMSDAAAKLKVPLRSGVYLAVAGPNYETPSEIKMFGWLGADAVGMSMVPEVIVARQVGLEVAALALITNWAAGITGRRLSHDEVLQMARAAADTFGKLMDEFIEGL